jgi:ankyrin repeat protein
MFRAVAIWELIAALAGTACAASKPASLFVLADSANRPLQFVIGSGKLGEVRQSIESGADVNERDGAGSTPLMMAVLAGNPEITTYLLSRGAEVNARSGQNGSTALSYAVMAGRADLIKILLAAGARADFRYGEQQTVLHMAAAGRCTECVRLLLDAHCDMEGGDARGYSALDEAVLHGRADITSQLLSRGANVHRIHAFDGRDALHQACVKGFAPLVPLLVAAGADPTARDWSGQTPVDLALDYKSVAAVRALLHLTPQQHGVRETFDEAMERAVQRGRSEVARILLDSGWSVNERTTAGSTYLNDAALAGRVKVARLLLDRGAHVDARNQNGGTPLHDAAISGNAEMISLLLDRGAAIDATDLESGATPLMLAASLGKTEAVSLLLRRGANPTLTDKAGRTALTRAEENQNPDLLRLLETASGKRAAAMTRTS